MMRIVEVFDGFVDRGEKVLSRADVVDGYCGEVMVGLGILLGVLRTGSLVGTVV